MVSATNITLRFARSDHRYLTDGDSRIELNAQAVLVALLTSISQFWSVDELVRLCELSLENRPVFLSLRKTMAKRVHAKQLLPALLRIWSELVATPSVCTALLCIATLLLNLSPQSTWSSREAYFDLFKRVVRSAPRDDIHDHLRDIFKLFLDAFDLCNQLNRQVNVLLLCSVCLTTGLSF